MCRVVAVRRRREILIPAQAATDPGLFLPALDAAGTLETVNALYPKDEGYVKGCLHWFGISTALMIGAYVFTGLIPFFSQMNSLIGALFDPLLRFVLPSIMLYKSGIEMSTLDKLGGLFYVFVVGLFAWGPGTGVAIYSIAESSDDVGGPFSCQCIAKQCST